MTIGDWNPDNFKISFPPIKHTGSVVSAPTPWKVANISYYLQNTVIRDAKNAVINGSKLSGLVLIISIVDYLASFYKGQKTTPQDYIDFLNDFFPGKYKPFSESIYYQLRCGLLHNLVSTNPFPRNVNINKYDYCIVPESSDHLELSKNGKTIFSVNHFLTDISRAAHEYFFRLIIKSTDNDLLINNFKKRFRKLNGAGAIMYEVIIPEI